MEERKIGEIFEIDDTKLICIEETNLYLLECNYCYFIDKTEKCRQQLCLAHERKDHKPVYFKEIK